jgi:hypothetical protein
MVRYQNIAVFLSRLEGGGRFAEYKIPEESPNYPGAPKEVYVEAQDGYCFQINTRLMMNFDFEYCSHVKIDYIIDEETADDSYTEEVSNKRFLEVTKNRSRKYTHTLADGTRNVDGAWESYGLAFSALAIGEST